MKLYRDMTPEERAHADWEHELVMLANKRDAEWEMNWFDQLFPEQRKLEREREDELAEW
jgi:hypothetical protein